MISDQKKLTKQFNSYYITIAEKNSGSKPKTFGINFENASVQPVRDIANSYRNNPSIIKIKQVVIGSYVSDSERFSFKTVNETEVKTLFRNLYMKKASGIGTDKAFSQFCFCNSQTPSTQVLHKMFFQKRVYQQEQDLKF